VAEKHLGKPVVVVNRPGANAMILQTMKRATQYD
jgi:tripartite-type tricarboxylate transporter receptor subunit TctC